MGWENSQRRRTLATTTAATARATAPPNTASALATSATSRGTRGGSGLWINVSSPLVGEGCGALVSEANLGEAGWGVTPHEHCSERTKHGSLPHRSCHAFSSTIVRRHPPSQPSPTRGEGAYRALPIGHAIARPMLGEEERPECAAN